MFESFYKGKIRSGYRTYRVQGSPCLLFGCMNSVHSGFALPPNTEPNHFNLIELTNLIHHSEGDICDLQAVTQAFDSAKPEIVFHLAAQPLVRDSYDDPKTTFEWAARSMCWKPSGIKKGSKGPSSLPPTSVMRTGNGSGATGKNDPMGGHDPYSASKGATEIICTAYSRSYFNQNGRGPHLGLATARAGNVIGGGDWAKDRIFPDCIRALSKGEPIRIRNPQATRPMAALCSGA